MSVAQVLVLFPGSLHGGEWAVGPVVKPELVSVWSHLRRAGHEVRVVDLEAEGGEAGGAGVAQLELGDAGAARLAAVACPTALQYSAAIAAAATLRSAWPQAAIAVFGQHPTVRPDDFTYDGTPFSWVIQGDAESSLAEIADDVTGGGSDPATCRLGEGGAFGLSAETAPDYSGYPYARPSLPSLGVYLSRGCQYASAICFTRPGGGPWHGYPPEVAVRLLGRLIELRPALIEVLDPTFGYDPAWRAAMLGRLVVNDRRPVPLSVTARPDALARKDLDAIYRARLRLRLNLGTLSPTLLSATAAAPQPGRRIEQTLDLLTYANAKGVPAQVDLTFGQPGESRRTADETLDALAGLARSFPNTSLHLAAVPWSYFPAGSPEMDVDAPLERYGTRLVHPEWWKEALDFATTARAVVPSSDLADLEPGDDSYWRPRFEEIAAVFKAKLTEDARHDLRSHESVGSVAADVPHGFYREPRWH